ncbi:hypothetical protein BJX61DRAFT_264134 [Aspergillus egyptiacus]|nr:hypothetical protein BJX61DRAFT_264134 [Aspergillus egyptiacus]
MHFSGVLAVLSAWLAGDHESYCPASGIEADSLPAGRCAAALPALAFPGTSEFTAATERWSTYQAPTFAAALPVGSEQELATAVRFATSHNIPFLATGTRHGYGSTLGGLQGGLALDLSPLDSISVDTSAGTLTVGPGVTSGEVFDPVFDAGYSVPTGTCSCVGLIGATLGAGIGRLTGTHGLMIDALLSARVVTASGDILEASSTANPDLFWALRGAGQNFGIVTSATYALTPITHPYTSVDLIIAPDHNTTFFHWLAAFNHSADWAIAAQISYSTDTNSPILLANCVYHGPRDAALASLHPLLLDIGPGLVFMNVTEVPWNRLSATAGFASDAATCQPGQIHDIYGVTLRHRSAATWIAVFDAMGAFYATHPRARGCMVIFEAWANHAAVNVADAETAYPWRDAQIYTMIQGTWQEGDKDAKVATQTLARQLRSMLAATSGYGDLAVYVNYAKGDETLEQIYGARKLRRLAELKRRYDPGNVFRFHHSLPVDYP